MTERVFPPQGFSLFQVPRMTIDEIKGAIVAFTPSIDRAEIDVLPGADANSIDIVIVQKSPSRAIDVARACMTSYPLWRAHGYVVKLVMP